MKIRKELYFGFGLMVLILVPLAWMLLTAKPLTNGHLGLTMLALVVVAIMMGFPTAFTLMGMGIFFTWLAYEEDWNKTLDLMVQSAFKVMSNDVLIAVPLFVFMGYLVERANLIERLFKSMHLMLARVPGALAVATIFTCALFATATGIVGAVVTLMGLLALPQMLKAGYDVRLSAGSITAGGCLGILIPPSVLLIVYGATAGVSVVQLYAGAFFPGLMLAGLYVVYVIILAKWKPHLAPELSAEQRRVPLPEEMQKLGPRTRNALLGLLSAARSPVAGTSPRYVRRQLVIAVLPALLFAGTALLAYRVATAPREAAAVVDVSGGGLREPGGGLSEPAGAGTGLQEPSGSGMGLSEPPSSEGSSGLAEPPSSDEPAPAGASDGGVAPPPGSRDAAPSAATGGLQEPPGAAAARAPTATSGLAEPGAATASAGARAPVATAAGMGFWIGLGVGALLLVGLYWLLSFERFEVFKMLLTSFFPLFVLIIAVLGSIVFGLATPTEAAAVGAFGGYALACLYALIARKDGGQRALWLLWTLLWLPCWVSIVWFFLWQGGFVAERVPMALGYLSVAGVAIWSVIAWKQVKLKEEVRESVYLTAKTSAMVCWLFVGSAIFSAAFALLGGQELVEKWVLSLNLTKTEFMIMAQVVIFFLGWPLEWTEIIVIFMPIFIPLLDNFGVDPLLFGLLVALNLQTAFLSPPVAMAAFYLKGVSPPHVTLNQIFAGMLPFMGIQIIAIVLLYIWPEIGLWLPQVLYR